jgi:hypothetical protein
VTKSMIKNPIQAIDSDLVDKISRLLMELPKAMAGRWSMALRVTPDQIRFSMHRELVAPIWAHEKEDVGVEDDLDEAYDDDDDDDDEKDTLNAPGAIVRRKDSVGGTRGRRYMVVAHKGNTVKLVLLRKDGTEGKGDWLLADLLEPVEEGG